MCANAFAMTKCNGFGESVDLAIGLGCESDTQGQYYQVNDSGQAASKKVSVIH